MVNIKCEKNIKDTAIDCFIIGINEKQYAKDTRITNTGKLKEFYKHIFMDFITIDDKRYLIQDIYNEFIWNKVYDTNLGPYHMGNQFSATISYLGTFLHRRGLNFEFANSFRDQKDFISESLKNKNIRSVVIPTTYYTSEEPIQEIVEFIREYDSTVKIIVGGPHVLNISKHKDERGLRKFVQRVQADIYISSSQGEATLVKVLKALRKGETLEGIDNIIWKRDNGYTISSFKEELNLIEENIVDWSLFEARVGKSAAVRTAISCPFSCSFCTFPELAGKHQALSIDKLEEELNLLSRTGVESVHFIDDTFNVPKERFKKILLMMIKNKYTFSWSSFIRCQYLDEETVYLMKKSNCEGVHLGIESGNQTILNNMNKKVQVYEYKRGIKLLNDYEITSFASFIVGFPGETDETIKDTIDFIEETCPTFYIASIWYGDRMSPIYAQKDFSIVGSGSVWTHSTMNSSEAIEHLYNISSSIKKSIRLPQSGFDTTGVINLTHRGMSLGTIKKFIKLFNKLSLNNEIYTREEIHELINKILLN